MGLLDLFRKFIPATPNNNERLGPNDLPSDVLNDLRNDARNRQDQSTGNYDEEVPEDTLHHWGNEHHFSGDSQHFRSFNTTGREFDDAFREMDNILKHFFGTGPSIGFYQGQGDPPKESDSRERAQPLREKMLDDAHGNSDAVLPFHHEDGEADRFTFKFHTPFFRQLWQSPFHRQGSPYDGRVDDDFGNVEDKDLDGDSMDRHMLDDILDSQVPRESNELLPFGFGDNLPFSNDVTSAFKYSTVTKKMNPDGSVETTTRKRDSEGNEEVTVTRNLGEQTHTVITKKNNNGEEEKIENFLNMDENDLQTFDEKWEQKSQKSPRDILIAPEKNELFDMFSTWWKPKL